MKKKPIDTELQQSFNRIKDICCSHYRITEDEFYSKSRDREIVISRQISIHAVILVYEKKYGYKTYGSLINKDHATAMHCEKVINNLIATDKKFKITHDKIIKSFINTPESLVYRISRRINEIFKRNRYDKIYEYRKELDLETHYCLSLI